MQKRVSHQTYKEEKKNNTQMASRVDKEAEVCEENLLKGEKNSENVTHTGFESEGSRKKNC